MSNHTIQKVTGLHLGFSNSALRTPFAMYKLACGHVVGNAATVGNLNECLACGAKFRGPNDNHLGGLHFEPTVCKCGNSTHYANKGPGMRILALPNPHKAEDRQPAPVSCRCEQCEREEVEFAMIPELVAASVHSRFREWGGGIITFYGRVPSSPTGVLAIASISATKRAFAEISRCNSSISPLSPTEGLGRGR